MPPLSLSMKGLWKPLALKRYNTIATLTLWSYWHPWTDTLKRCLGWPVTVHLKKFLRQMTEPVQHLQVFCLDSTDGTWVRSPFGEWYTKYISASKITIHQISLHLQLEFQHAWSELVNKAMIFARTMHRTGSRKYRVGMMAWRMFGNLF